MIDLKKALKLTDCRSDEVVFLKWEDKKLEILTVVDIRNKYDMRRVKVTKIKPKFYKYDYAGMEFEVKEGKGEYHEGKGTGSGKH